MTTTIETTALGRQAIAAMHHADTVVFRWALDEPGEMRLSKRNDPGDGFGERDLSLTVPMLPPLVANFGSSTIGSHEHKLPPAVSGEWVLLCLKVSNEWHTVARAVKRGDHLRLELKIDSRNSLLSQARLTLHEINLQILRPLKSIAAMSGDPYAGILMTYVLDHRVERDTDTGSLDRKEA